MNSARREFWYGFRVILPLWFATAPTALAYVFAAKKAGLSDLEIQVLSLALSSAVTQLALLNASQVSFLTALVTVALLNMHYIIYGLSLARKLNLKRGERFGAALFLTDAVYGFTVTDPKATLLSLLGAEASMFLAWNLLTAVGLILHHLILTITLPPLDIVAPLAFCGMLALSLKTWRDVSVMLVAMASAIVFNALGLKSMTILLTTGVAVIVGVWMSNSPRMADHQREAS